MEFQLPNNLGDIRILQPEGGLQFAFYHQALPQQPEKFARKRWPKKEEEKPSKNHLPCFVGRNCPICRVSRELEEAWKEEAKKIAEKVTKSKT